MKIFVANAGLRPDHRLFGTFLWREDQDLDSDGDAKSPADRTWTELTLIDRAPPRWRFDMDPHPERPDVFVVESETEVLALRAAYFLAREAGGTIHLDALDAPAVSSLELDKRIGAEWLRAAIERAAKSLWRRATDHDPYPPRES